MAAVVESKKVVIPVRVIGRHPTLEDVRVELASLRRTARDLLHGKDGLSQEDARDLSDELARLANTIEDQLIGAESPTFEGD